jgi:hypothetical protein
MNEQEARKKYGKASPEFAAAKLVAEEEIEGGAVVMIAVCGILRRK